MAKSAKKVKSRAIIKKSISEQGNKSSYPDGTTIVLVQKDTSGNIVAKDAIQIARTQLVDLLKLSEEPQLEEIEITKDKHWYITFSLTDSSRANIHLLPILPRRFKVVKLDATNGKLISISIRDVNG